jgi:hypothetical protein
MGNPAGTPASPGTSASTGATTKPGSSGSTALPPPPGLPKKGEGPKIIGKNEERTFHDGTN